MLLALVSTGIFLLQFVISIFFGGLDIDVDGDTNVDFRPWQSVLLQGLNPLSYWLRMD